MQEETVKNYVKHIWLLGGIDHGNLGDHYIQKAMCEFLTDIVPDIYIQEIPIEDYYKRKHYLMDAIQPEDVLVFCGGGNLGSLWPRLENLRRDAFAVWPENPKIVFPQSIYFDESDTEAINQSIQTYSSDRCLLALRDPASYELGRNMFQCKTMLTPDIVMYTDAGWARQERKGILLLLRNDKESALSENDKNYIAECALECGIDTIKEYDTVLKYSVKSDTRTEKLQDITNLIASRQLVITDRLHGMIISAVTGTPCIVLPNSYHKISSFISWVKDLTYIHYCERPGDLPDILRQVDLKRNFSYPLDEKRRLFADFRKECEHILTASDRKQDIKVSVIVPVYNVEQYLEECLDSILGQTMKNIEIICVNDGSTDRSRDILCTYAAKDSRISIVDQENRGLSGARNTGIRHAKGDYLYFVDSDDYIAPDTIELCCRKMIDFRLDLLCFNAAAFNDGDEFKKRTDELNEYYERKASYPGIYTGKELLSEMLKNHDYIVPVWSYFYRTSVIRDNHISFIEGIYHEDNSFTYEMLLSSNRVSYIPEKLYFRRVRENSITTIHKSFKHVYGYFACGMEMLRFLTARETDRDFISEQVKWIDSNVLSSSRWIYDSLSKEEKEKHMNLPAEEMAEFTRTVIIPAKKEKQLSDLLKKGETASDLAIENTELKKQLDNCTKELHEIKNSKLYRYLLSMRNIKHKITD